MLHKLKSYLDKFSLPRRVPDADDVRPLPLSAFVLPILFDFGKNVRFAEQMVLFGIAQIDLGATVLG